MNSSAKGSSWFITWFKSLSTVMDGLISSKRPASLANIPLFFLITKKATSAAMIAAPPTDPAAAPITVVLLLLSEFTPATGISIVEDSVKLFELVKQLDFVKESLFVKTLDAVNTSDLVNGLDAVNSSDLVK